MASLYAQLYGWAVFPVEYRGKSPLTKHGFKDACKDLKQIDAWWTDWPDAGIGLATGDASGRLIVLDFDEREEKGKHGLTRKEEWEKENGPFPQTVTARTGGGGLHVVFRYHEGEHWKSEQGLFSDKSIDIRADGGYVVVAPSVHPNGKKYEWINAPENTPVAYIDDNVRAFIQAGRKKETISDGFMMPESLPDGSRTESLVKLLGSLQSKGLTDEAITAAVRAENTARCDPPLTERELQREVFPALTRWKKGDNPYFSEGFDPTDRTDMGQARAFIQWADGGIRYLGTRKNTGQWLVYNGFKWEANDNRAMREVQRFTSLQLQAARGLLDSARRALDAAQENGTGTEGEARARLKGAESFWKFALKYRGNSQVKATLAQAAPMVSIRQEQLDADTHILNTPAGTIELQTCTLRENRAADYCTKATAVTPSAEGEQLWRDFLLQLTCGDKELMNYLQIMAGAFLYGSGKPEKLFIAHGSGGNGKSTFFNALSRVLGDYAVQVSSDWLVDHHNGTDYETVRLRGARLAQASELEEGKTINTALVKRVTSTDRLPANEKYRDVFDFIPTHSLVLHTNHLPAVRALDHGTWDRLVVIPFNARFRGEDGEKLGYDSFLFENAGGAILQWCIEGAKRFNDIGRRLPKCAVVDNATAGYMGDNDWLGAFFDSCITMEPGAQITGIELHNLYQTYCTQAGERPRSRQELVAALRMRGIESRHTKKGALYNGMRRKEQSAAARAFG